jgi:hypothetical protein
MVGHAPRISRKGQRSRQKKIVQKVGVFFGSGKRLSKNHVYHASHHVLTSKKPSPTTHFFQKPPQKLKKLRKFPVRQPHEFFFAKKETYNVNRMWLKVFSSGVKKTLKIKLPPTKNRMIMPNIPTRS